MEGIGGAAGPGPRGRTRRPDNREPEHENQERHPKGGKASIQPPYHPRGNPAKTHTAPYARMTQMPMITHLKRLCAGVRSFEVKSLFTPLPRAVCAAVSEVVAMRPH